MTLSAPTAGSDGQLLWLLQDPFFTKLEPHPARPDEMPRATASHEMGMKAEKQQKRKQQQQQQQQVRVGINLPPLGLRFVLPLTVCTY